MAAAAQQAGAEIRTGADIAEIRVKDGVATGVVLTSGEEISARAVVSNADPKRTLMRLVDPAHLTPDFLQKIKNYRCTGTVAKINLAISTLPEFTALKAKANGNLLQGRIQISPEIDYLERDLVSLSCRETFGHHLAPRYDSDVATGPGNSRRA